MERLKFISSEIILSIGGIMGVEFMNGVDILTMSKIFWQYAIGTATIFFMYLNYKKNNPKK